MLSAAWRITSCQHVTILRLKTRTIVAFWNITNVRVNFNEANKFSKSIFNVYNPTKGVVAILSEWAYHHRRRVRGK